MLDYSIGELEALVVKAYRGAGHSWGLAQEAGAAAAWLATRGLASAEPMSLLVPAVDGQPIKNLLPATRNRDQWSGTKRFLCPVVTGTTLSDFGLDGVAEGCPLSLLKVLQPTVLLPFLCRLPINTVAKMNNTVYLCGCGDAQVLSGGRYDEASLPVNVTIEVTDQSIVPSVIQQRAIVDDASISVLLGYAHRTYVPATEASRAGAGAGLLDND